MKKVIILNGRATKISISRSLAESDNYSYDETLPSIYNSQQTNLDILEKLGDFDNWAKKFVETSRTEKEHHSVNDPTLDDEYMSQMENIVDYNFFSLILKSNNEELSNKNSAIDDDFIFDFFQFTSLHPNFYSISQKVIILSTRHLLSVRRRSFSFKKLRLISMLLYLPTLYANADHLNSVIKIVGTLPKNVRPVFCGWLSSFPHLLSRVVSGCQFLLNTFYDNYPLATTIDTSQTFIFETLDLCYEANQMCLYKLPLSAFYNKNIDDRGSGKLLPFPFVLSFQSRLKMCKNQTRELQVSAEVEHMLRGSDGRLGVYLRRSSYFSDFQKYFLKAKPSAYYRRLKVFFIDEIAVDAGGPQKECLRMVAENLKEKTLRIVNNRLFWFKRCPVKSCGCDESRNKQDDISKYSYLTDQQKKSMKSKQALLELINDPLSNYKLLGIVVGLAIANDIILPIRFPRILYSLMMKNQKPTLSDFMEIDPIAGASLQSILDMKRRGEDVSQLDMTFEITNDEGETIDLNNQENSNVDFAESQSQIDCAKPKRGWAPSSNADGTQTIYSIAMATAVQKGAFFQGNFKKRYSKNASSLVVKTGQVASSKPKNPSSSFTTSFTRSSGPIKSLPDLGTNYQSKSYFQPNVQSGNIPSKLMNENVELFVRRYIDYEINHRYARELDAFRAGFLTACPSPYISFLAAEELDLVASGAEELNWSALEAAAKYKDGLDKGDEEVKWFWEVFWLFSEEQRIEFLKFTTGSDRAPYGGLGKVRITFKRGGKQEMLPVAHTCFNMFFLPKYPSKEVLKKKLLLAFKYSEGFGIE